MKLTSSAFTEGQTIPKEFTCEGKDISPDLVWQNAPQNVQSFALICDDPDAPVGTWVHWIIWNIPADSTGLASATPTHEKLADGSQQGRNDFGRLGYGGPCPPKGKPHRYFFKLYALDTVLALKSGATKKDLWQAMQSHVVAEAQLMGTYKR